MSLAALTAAALRPEGFVNDTRRLLRRVVVLRRVDEALAVVGFAFSRDVGLLAAAFFVVVFAPRRADVVLPAADRAEDFFAVRFAVDLASFLVAPTLRVEVFATLRRDVARFFFVLVFLLGTATALGLLMRASPCC